MNLKQVTPNIAQMRMLAAMRGQLWAIRPDAVSELALAALEANERVSAASLSPETLDALSLFYPMREPMRMEDGIAKIEIVGGLMQKASIIEESLGLVTRYETIVAETEAAIEQGARGIVYRFDSPGGTVAGLHEAAMAIHGAGIPTMAYASGLCCSAAYYLAAGTKVIVASESAEVGNIGTILSWTDCSAFWAAQGVEFKALTNEGADLKSTFHVEPDDAQLAFLQEKINVMGERFKAWVIENRPQVSPEVFRAGWYSGRQAEELGLINAINTFQYAINKWRGSLDKSAYIQQSTTK